MESLHEREAQAAPMHADRGRPPQPPVRHSPARTAPPRTPSAQSSTVSGQFDDGPEPIRFAAAAPAAPQTARQAAAGPGHNPGLAADTGFGSLDTPVSTILGKVVLGYAPVLDQDHEIIATRLTVIPLDTQTALDATALLRVVTRVWRAGDAPVSLNVASEALLAGLLQSAPPSNVMVEVPCFLATEPANLDGLPALAARGTTLLLKGRPLQQLPHEVLKCFRWSIIDVSEERRARLPEGSPWTLKRVLPHLQIGVRSLAQAQECFARGAAGVIGWPLDEPNPDASASRPDRRGVAEMVARLDRGAPVEAVEDGLLRDPALAFELLCHLDAAASGLRVETSSFRHVMAMLGRDELRHWLSSWPVDGARSDPYRPLKFAALRRGFLMRELGAAFGGVDGEDLDELFMCGLFSLLDRMYDRPIGELVTERIVPERVRQALVDGSGPFVSMLDLARAVESEMPHEIRAATQAAFVEPRTLNRALLRALTLASALDGAVAAA